MDVFRCIRSWGIAAALLLGAGPMAAEAELLIYEPFDYAAGVELDGLAATGLNLAGSYATSTIQDLVIGEPGLTYGSLQGGLPGVSGNRLADASGVGAGIVTVALEQAVLIDPGSEIFFSALFTLDDSTGGNRFARISFLDDDSGDELSFGEAVVGSRAVRVTAETAATGGLVADGADGAFTDGQTLWLIGRYFNSPEAGGDALELLGYDTALAGTIGAGFDLSDPGAQFAFSLSGLDIDFAQITSLRFEIRGDGNNFIDELRVGSTFAAVVIPEPSSGVLLLLGLVFVGWAAAGGRRRLAPRSGDAA